MYFVKLIKDKYPSEKIDIYVDMDGVIADYNVGHVDYLNKRPITTNINTLKKLSLNDNITMHILSVCRKNSDIEDKNIWLNKYAPFFQKENRHIISKEINPGLSSKELKFNFLKDIKKAIVFIDDDNDILKYVHEKLPNIDLYQDSSIID